MQAWTSAVAAAMAGNAAQQRQAQVWFDASLPTDPQAHAPADSNAPNLSLGGGLWGPIPRARPRCRPANSPPADTGYPTSRRPSPPDAVLAEARAVIGDLTIVFCGDCIREAALRLVDGA